MVMKCIRGEPKQPYQDAFVTKEGAEKIVDWLGLFEA
jgi:hypothetical protein